MAFKHILLISAYFLILESNLTLGLNAFGSWPGKLLLETESAITKGMDKTQSGIDFGINKIKTPMTTVHLGIIPNTASTINTKAFEETGKLRDRGFGMIKSFGTISGGSTSTQTSKSVTSTTDQDGKTVQTTTETASNTVTDASGVVKPVSESITTSTEGTVAKVTV